MRLSARNHQYGFKLNKAHDLVTALAPPYEALLGLTLRHLQSLFAIGCAHICQRR
jgi:hypothetical protein